MTGPPPRMQVHNEHVKKGKDAGHESSSNTFTEAGGVGAMDYLKDTSALHGCSSAVSQPASPRPVVTAGTPDLSDWISAICGQSALS